MAGRAEKAVLADGGMRTNRDFCHAVAVHPLAQASVVAHFEIPGRPDTGRRIRMHRLAQLGAEETQQQAAPRVQKARCRPVQKQPDDLPHTAGKLVAQRKLARSEFLSHVFRSGCSHAVRPRPLGQHPAINRDRMLGNVVPIVAAHIAPPQRTHRAALFVA